MELRPVEASRLEVMRREYRKRLAIPMVSDLHEALCQVGKAYSVEEMGREIGYVIFAPETFLPDWDPVIPEFHLNVKQTKYARPLLEAIFDKLSPATVMSRTDDMFGFPLLMDMRLPNQVAASLYSLESEPGWTQDPDVEIEPCQMEHAEELLSLYASVKPEDGGIPDVMALTKSLALWRHYRLKNSNQTLAACYSVPQAEPFVTIACIVDPGARQKGYGRYLAAYAVRRELGEGKKFIAMVPADNEAARGLVESLGAQLKAHFVYFKP